MTKVILIVWLLAGRDSFVFQYAVKYENEAQCIAQAEKMKDTRTGFVRSYPIQYANCVMEIKR